MRNLRFIFTCFLVLTSLVSEGAYYRWVDAKGITHYSSSVPPSIAQSGYIELSKGGIKKKTFISSKRKREKEAKLKKLQAKKILDAKKKKEKRKQEEEEIRLLSIFSTEEEIMQTYNSKLRMAQLTIDLLKSRHKKQSKKLEVIEQRNERSKNMKHKRVLRKQIEVSLDNLSIYQQAITENIVEKDRVRKEFKKTLSQFQKIIEREALSKAN